MSFFVGYVLQKTNVPVYEPVPVLNSTVIQNKSNQASAMQCYTSINNWKYIKKTQCGSLISNLMRSALLYIKILWGPINDK